MRRRDFFDWHAWLGLTTGLMMFVICWSGTIAVFSYEIDWLINPALRAAQPPAELDWEGAAIAAEAALPGAILESIHAPRYPGFAMEARLDSGFENTVRLYLDPASLEVLGDSSYFNVQRFFRSFHMALFEADYVDILGVPVGYFVVALLAIPLIALLVTSLVFYRRWWRGFFKLDFQKGGIVLFSDLHKAMGVWSLWFVAVIALTGIWYLVEWWLPSSESPTAGTAAVADGMSITELVMSARTAFPELSISSISMSWTDDKLLQVSGHDGTLLTRGRASAWVDIGTGEVVHVYRQDSSLLARLRETMDVLHFGTFGGLWSQALYFVFGLALSALALTGAYLHALRQSRKGDGVGLRRALWTSVVVTLALLAMASIAGWQNIKSYGPLVDGVRHWPEVPSSALFVIAAWTASTVFLIAVWCVWLLRIPRTPRRPLRDLVAGQAAQPGKL